MPTRLRELLSGTRQRLLWLEYDEYARQVFANGASDWLTQSGRFSTTMIQARKALKTEVVSLDIAAPGMAAVTRAAEPLATCLNALADPIARRFVGDCIDALAHQLGSQVDLVLRVPSPLDLLRQVGGGAEASFDELDEVGAALVASVRQFAEKPISGLLLTRSVDTAMTRDEQDAYSPLLQAAKHYSWVTCLQCTESVVSAAAAQWSEVDLVLCAALSRAQVTDLNTRGLKFGGGLAQNIWSDRGHSLEKIEATLLFGTVPSDANPETVLARCSSLAVAE
ncbi:MAG: hypothetical protein EXR86_06505 [Gammaproteobacteria bacterium]|nr:hypothetical protein [Gammaproteobacteria bacterium]